MAVFTTPFPRIAFHGFPNVGAVAARQGKARQGKSSKIAAARLQIFYLPPYGW